MTVSEPSRSVEPADAADNRRAFDAWLDDFFAAYYRRRPVDATFIGFHDHDRLLPDYSAGGRDSSVAAMRSLLAQLETIPAHGLTPTQRQDRRLAAGQLELEIWEDAAAQFYRGNPSVSTGEGVFAVMSLFLRDSEPLADRIEAAIARMRALPAWLAQARSQVSDAPLAWTARAIREARSAIAYFGRGIPILAHERGIDAPAFLDAAGIARDAFGEHLNWLEGELTARPIAAAGCGEAALSRYLRAGHQLPSAHDAAWVAERGRAAFVEARDRLVTLAAMIDPNRTWQEQVAQVGDDHPNLEDYYDAYGRVWVDARRAVLDADLLTWPDFPIEYVPIPHSDREAAAGLYYLFYRCPAPLGRVETHRYLVTPIDATTSEEERERRLRTANHAAIKLNHVVHHGGLGHHVQNWHAVRATSRIGKVAGVDGASRIAMFCAGTLVEGWACYATDLMEEIGALSPVESLIQAHGRLRMAARAVADVAFHVGEWSLEETAAFYERETGMPAAAAAAEAVKNSMFPGAALMYLIGTDAIHELRRDLAAREGASFSLRSFHDRFLAHGAIPVSMIREAMLGSA